MPRGEETASEGDYNREGVGDYQRLTCQRDGMILQRIHDALAQMRDVEFAGGVGDALISDASRRLGLPFPPEYVAFLKEFGCGGVSSDELIGLGGARHLDVVWITEGLRGHTAKAAFLNALIPLWTDGYGNYDCIDTSRPSSGEEFQVIEWLHDSGVPYSPRILAQSHTEWLLAKLSAIQELDEEEREPS